jgi:hypothetical protein
VLETKQLKNRDVSEPSHVRAALLSAPRFLPPSYLGETHEGCSHSPMQRAYAHTLPVDLKTSGNGGRLGQACTHLVRYRPVAADGMRECVRHVIMVHRAGGETVVTVCRNSASVAVAHIQDRSRCARLIFACTRTLPLAVAVLGAWWATRSAADGMGAVQVAPRQEMPN